MSSCLFPISISYTLRPTPGPGPASHRRGEADRTVLEGLGGIPGDRSSGPGRPPGDCSPGPPGLPSDPDFRGPWELSPTRPGGVESDLGKTFLGPVSRVGCPSSAPVHAWPGRPGWSPTQVPHRSGLAHHAHLVPHLMNSRPARSVVVTWTWFRSQCTWHVSLQRLMRRHPLPLTGSLGLVPPLQRYYEVLRLPAAHFAALRFLRLAIPSLRPWFVPPGPGRGAVDQSGVGRRYLQPPCSMETTGSPKFPEEPL